MIRIDNVSLSSVSTALRDFGTTVKNILPRKKKIDKQSSGSGDKFAANSDSEPRTEEERTRTAVMKANEANRERLVAEINRSGEIDSVYDKLLPEYSAYQNPELKDFTPVSSDTVTALFRKKQVEIKFSTTEDDNKQQDIKFADGSQISYITFTKDGKMKINEEEFEMPEGTIIETKSINGRVISQFIQTPDIQRKVINKPEYLDEAEEVLKTYTPPEPEPEPEVSQTPEEPAPAANEVSETVYSYGQALLEDFLSLTKNLKNNI